MDERGVPFTTALHPPGGTHVSHSVEEDMTKIVKEFHDQNALTCMHVGTCRHFAGVKDSLLASIKIAAMFKWTK